MELIWDFSQFALVSITFIRVLAIAKKFTQNRIFNLSKRQSRASIGGNVIAKPIQAEESLMMSVSAVQRQQRQLISDFSHELRTPLTTCYGYMQSISRRPENLTVIQKQAIEVAISEMKYTIQLLQESMDLARLDQESICFSMTSVSLNNVVADAIASFTDLLPIDKKPDLKNDANNEPKQKILVEGNELNIEVLADPVRLKQALLKLIDNAIKYSDTIVTIKLEKRGNHAVISICDRGCGIPLQDQPHIFSPFYRVDPSRSRITGGIGLGLAIAKVLVEGMEGSLDVESQLGVGSIFRIKLKSAV